MNEFRKNAEANRQEDFIDIFPEAAVAETLQNTWHEAAVSIYRNWLDILSLGKAQPYLHSSDRRKQRKRNAIRRHSLYSSRSFPRHKQKART